MAARKSEVNWMALRFQPRSEAMTATATDPRRTTEAEVFEIARRAKRDPASLTDREIRAVALYVSLMNR